MKLDEFVETSLIEIIEGVKKAQKATKESNKTGIEVNHINPDVMYSADSAPKGKFYATSDRNLVHFVDFDVAVTVDTGTAVKGGAGLRVAGIGVGADVQESSQNIVVSRIKFQVPIILPKS